MKDLRRLVIVVVIGSFSLAALLGILALLSGEFGDDQARVLLTTVIVGVESTVVLCLLALAGHPWVPVSWFGAAASVVATGAALALTWGDNAWDDGRWEDLLRLFGTSAILAGTSAQLALLIALVLRPGREPGGLAALLGLTGLAGALVAILAIGPIVSASEPDDGYWQLLGVLAILDVLGSVVLVALGAFGRVRERIETPASAVSEVRLSAAQQQRIEQWAREHRTTPTDVVQRALDSYLSGQA